MSRLNSEEERTGTAMAHWPLQLRRTLGLSAALLSLLLVQNALGFPFRKVNANLSPRMLYHNLESLVGVVLTGSSHVVDDVRTLYELRQLALGASPPERSSVAVSPRSPRTSSAQSLVCNYRAIPAPSGTDYRCPRFRRGSTSFSSVGRC